MVLMEGGEDCVCVELQDFIATEAENQMTRAILTPSPLELS
jgi:hypothetical protein